MVTPSKIAVDACCHIPDANIKGRALVGKSTCGVLIVDSGGEEHEFSRSLGEMTPPQAEFEGLIFALDKASEVVNRQVPLEVWMDSDLVVKWMNGQYRLKKDHIKPLYDKATQLCKRFSSVAIFHHSRETILAKRADNLAQKEYERTYGRGLISNNPSNGPKQAAVHSLIRSK